jgi:hypothetical protein
MAPLAAPSNELGKLQARLARLRISRDLLHRQRLSCSLL